MSNGTSDLNSRNRINSIMKRVRREVGIRDVVVFGIARIWSVVLIVAAVFFVIADKWASLSAGKREHSG